LIIQKCQGRLRKVKEVSLNPDMIIRSTVDAEVELFYRHYKITPLTEKYLCVVVKVLTGDLFIITAYFTNEKKRGETLWQRK
jgi:hypothetical protein